MPIPTLLVAVLKGETFVDNLSLSNFTRQFSVFNPLVLNNKAARWAQYLTMETPAGTLFDYPIDARSTWIPEIIAFPPIYDHLQMEREEVRVEMRYVRDQLVGTDVVLVFEGGDGLSYSQMIHEIAESPDEWLFVPEGRLPIVLPTLGQEPHAGYHGLHTGFRNYRELIVVVGTHIQAPVMCIIDPPVSFYNTVRFEIYKLICGFSEWFVDLSKTPGAPNLMFSKDWRAGAEENIDFEWAFHVLFDFGFWWLQFTQARRADKSKLFDLLWCEFVASGRTMVANNTNYGFMAILPGLPRPGTAPGDFKALPQHKVPPLHDGQGSRRHRLVPREAQLLHQG